jgi:hypothetical protein
LRVVVSGGPENQGVSCGYAQGVFVGCGVKVGRKLQKRALSTCGVSELY